MHESVAAVSKSSEKRSTCIKAISREIYVGLNISRSSLSCKIYVFTRGTTSQRLGSITFSFFFFLFSSYRD